MSCDSLPLFNLISLQHSSFLAFGLHITAFYKEFSEMYIMMVLFTSFFRSDSLCVLHEIHQWNIAMMCLHTVQV